MNDETDETTRMLIRLMCEISDDNLRLKVMNTILNVQERENTPRQWADKLSQAVRALIEEDIFIRYKISTFHEGGKLKLPALGPVFRKMAIENEFSPWKYEDNCMSIVISEDINILINNTSVFKKEGNSE
jgi:hypothetical protein